MTDRRGSYLRWSKTSLWVLDLDGGTAALFKFDTGVPFVGAIPDKREWSR